MKIQAQKHFNLAACVYHEDDDDDDDDHVGEGDHDGGYDNEHDDDYISKNGSKINQIFWKWIENPGLRTILVLPPPLVVRYTGANVGVEKNKGVVGLVTLVLHRLVSQNWSISAPLEDAFDEFSISVEP